jgi:signal peptidase I
MQHPGQSEAAPVRRGLFATLYYVARHPLEFFDASGELPTRTSPLAFAVCTYAVGLAGAMLFALGLRLRTAEMLAAMAAGAVIGAAVALPQVYLASAIAHLSARVLGARAPFRRTLTALAYSTAPLVLLIVPFGGLVAIPYGIALSSIGIRQLQSLSWWRAVVAASMPVVLPIVLLVGIRTFGVEAFVIPSGSMAPTIQSGDHILVTKFEYGLLSKSAPARGDVIVFEAPEVRDGTKVDYVKRVVGLSGDVITVEEGRLSIGGVPVPLCRVGTTTLPDSEPGELFVEFLDGAPHVVFLEGGRMSRQEGPFRVAPNEVFVMGDNRNNAYDSRAWFGGRGGGVPFSKIKGRATMVWFPVNRLGSWIQRGKLDASAPPELRAALAACLAASR